MSVFQEEIKINWASFSRHRNNVYRYIVSPYSFRLIDAIESSVEAKRRKKNLPVARLTVLFKSHPIGIPPAKAFIFYSISLHIPVSLNEIVEIREYRH